MFWVLQYHGHERESRPPEKEVRPPVTRVGLGDTWVVGAGFPGILDTSTGAVSGSGTQLVVMHDHRGAAGKDGCHAFACGLVGASGETSRRPWGEITGAGDQVTESICRGDHGSPLH